jgi:serine/threonine protein kinase
MKIITERDKVRRNELLLEAKTQAQIHLECIPQIYDTFEWDNRICIVMQWLKGVSLRDILENRPAPEQCYYIADALIHTIAALHEQGYAHRDLKPENVLISPDYGMFLVDFGFTKSINDGKKSMSGIIKGTPAYMAPELWKSGSMVDPLRTDLFSLGRILDELFPDNCHMTTLIRPLLDNNPDNRPESAKIFHDHWKTMCTTENAHTSWKQISGVLSAQQHSKKLLTAAKELLYANRHDESYWLLVESLEENPDNEDAIEFMGKFPKSQNKKNHILLTIGIFILVLLVTAGAFYAGKLSNKTVSVLPDQKNLSHLSNVHKISSPKNFDVSSNSNYFREDTSKVTSLSGKIYFVNTPEHTGTLLIDNTVVDTTYVHKGIVVSYGSHTIVFKNSNGRIETKKKCTVLPFQTKCISLKQRQL